MSSVFFHEVFRELDLARQRADEPLEVAAAVRHVGIHVEARAGRRQQHDLPSHRDGMGELHGLRHRVARCINLVFGEARGGRCIAEAQGGVANEDQRIAALFDFRHEVREVGLLVVAARNQNDMAGERLKRLDGRVRVRGL